MHSIYAFSKQTYPKTFITVPTDAILHRLYLWLELEVLLGQISAGNVFLPF